MFTEQEHRHYPRHRELRPRRSILRNAASMTSLNTHAPPQFVQAFHQSPHSAPPTTYYDRPWSHQQQQHLDQYQCQLSIHPLLTPYNSSWDTIEWDMRFAPESNVCRHRGAANYLLSTFDKNAITSPTLGSISLNSIDYPWEIVVVARSPMLGVTFQDLFVTMFHNLDQPLLESELQGASPPHKQQIYEACKVRESFIPPPTFVYGNLKRIDWLMGNTAFCGLMEDPQDADPFFGPVPGNMEFACGLPEVEQRRRRMAR